MNLRMISMSSFVPHFTAGAIVGSIGAGVSLGIVNDSNALTVSLPLICGVMGALTPDMDIKSKSSMVMYLIFLSISCYFFFTERVDLAFLTLVYSILPQFFGHRGFIHSFVFCAISSIGLYFALTTLLNVMALPAMIVSITYFVGFLSHKALDV